ncbi:unnamed protein product [Closterium sp. NIES-53]
MHVDFGGGGVALAARTSFALVTALVSRFPQATELPCWVDLLKKGIDIYALDFDAILTAMYVMSTSGEGTEYLCVPPDPGIRASASAAPGTPMSATPGAGASRCFFRDRTTLEPLARPVAVSLADPSGGPVIATSSIVLPCPAVPLGTLSGLHLPSFSTNLVAGCALQDGGVHQFTPAYERVTHCTCARTGRHLATFTRQPGSDLYTLTTESPQVAAFASASASGQRFAPCSCRSLAHETVLWHHRLGHPSVQRLRAMHSRYLVSGLPRVLPLLPPSPAPPCLPCVEGRQRAAPHSSSFPLTTAPLQTLHMDVARLQLSERFRSDFPVLRLHSDRGGEFSSDLLAAYCAEHGIEQSFTLPASPQQNGVAERRIGLVMEVARTSLIHAAAPYFLWPFAVRYAAHQLNLWPRVSLPETSPTLLWTGEVGDASRFRVWGSRAFVRDTSAGQALLPRCSFPSPTTASSPTALPRSPPPPLFLAPGAAVVDPLPPQGAAPSGVSQVDPVEPAEVAVDSRPAAGVVPGGAAPGSAEPGGAESGGAEPGGAETGGTEPGGAEPGGTEPGGAEPRSPESGVLQPQERYLWSQVTTGAGASASPPRRELPSRDQIREWYERCCTLRSGVAGVTDPGAAGAAAGAAGPGVGAAAGTADPGVGAAAGAEDPGAGAATGAVEPGVGAAAGTEDSGVGATTGAEDPGAGAAAGAVESGAGAAGPVSATGAAAEGVGTETTAGGPAGGTPGAAGGSGAAGGAAGEGAPAGGTGAVPAMSGVAARPQPYFVPLLEQVLGSPPSAGLPPSLACPQPVPSQLQLQPTSPLPTPSPYTGPTGGLTERREPASRPASPVRPAHASGRGPRQRPPPVPGTHRMSLRPSTAPLRVPLPSPPESSLPALADPESDSLRAASPAVTRLLATAVTDPSFESSAASALVTELVDFAARCRLDYAASLVAESESVCPPSVGGECALGTDVLEDRQEEFQCLATASPHLVSVLLTPEGDPDALDIPTPRSYAEAIEGPYSSQWVKRLSGSPPVFKARYVARGFSQRQGVDYFQTFSPTPKMTTLRVLLHVAAHRDYELHSLDFSTAFLQGSLHEEIWLRRPLGFTGTFPPGTQWSLRRPVYGLRQAPREWHDTLRTTLAALGFAPSTADPSLFLRTDTSLPPFYILVYVDDLIFATADTAGLAHVKSELQKRHTCTDLGELRSYLGLQITRDRAQCTITLTQSHMVQQVLQRFGFTYSSPQATPLPTRHSLSALPSNESVESSGPYPELVGCLMYLMTCMRPDLAYPLSILARYVAPGRHRPEHMAAAKRVLRYLCSTSGMGLVLGGQSPVVLTGHADASWADDQATQRSSQGYTFSARLLTKHIALRYFLARELQQRGQLRLAYVASKANTADVFTKALAPCDHQRFCTQLGLVPVLPHLLTS